MTTPWDADALWAKAKLFINHAMDDDMPRSFDERALWAALALELLAKAALARVSPLLIATPEEDGKNILIATGLHSGTANFKSVKASTLFKRCAIAFRPFKLSEAQLIADNRNDYLHGASAAFAPIPEAAWWPRYWTQARILVEACHEDLSTFVGGSRVGHVEALLDRHNQNIQERVEGLIIQARNAVARYRNGQMNGREIQQWERVRDYSAGLTHSAVVTCPACNSANGNLEGDDEIDREVHWEQYSESDYDVTVALTIGASYFSCDTCHLVLDGYELIVAAGLDDTIDAEGDFNDAWEGYDYGND